MADQITTKKTTLTSDEVLARAVQFFATEKWKPVSQSARTATFEGKVPVPWGLMLLTFVGYLMCIVPGIILYVCLVRKVHRFQNLVITVTPNTGGCDVSISHPPYAKALVARFTNALP